MTVCHSKECLICGSPYVEKHHIFGASNRNNSEKYGLYVYLCAYHHRDQIHGVHGNRKLMDDLHQYGQRLFEMQHSREDFMRIFGRNYL